MGHMASQGYRDWVAAGKPFTLAAPLKRLRDILRGYGYTVYDIGNVSHQLADPPEDHMPYSATGWPNRSPRWYGFALDIMPPDDDDLPTLAQLGAQIYADKMAGHEGLAWLKYLNWEPGNGECHHDKWQPDHVRTDSGDRGHIHASGRSDHYLTDTTGGYDPVARWRENRGIAMNWTDKLLRDTGLKTRTYDDAIADQANLRNYWVAKPDAVTVAQPAEGSRIDLVVGAARKVLAAPPAQPAVVTMTQADREEIARLIVEQLGALQFVPANPSA